MRLRRAILPFIVFFITSACAMLVLPLQTTSAEGQTLASQSISLNNRYNNAYVNNVFKNNILLTLTYMAGYIHNKSEIDWEKINKPSRYNFILHPNEVFAFHDDVLSSYRNKQLVTTNSHFGSYEGFLSDGYLFGDGVCHLASLINWAALDAGLSVLAPTKHDFANIPDISKKYGVSIYSSTFAKESNQKQNLYIENNYDYPIVFAFEYKNNILSLTISKF